MGCAASRYWEWLKPSRPIDERLRWCHTTDAYLLRAMLAEGCITPQHCPVFGSSLTYFFYGRPAYRMREFEQIRISAKAPVVLVFSEAIETRGARVFPFDTGAFEARYGTWRHSKMTVSAFELPCAQSAPERHVSEFFGSREKYLALEASRPKRSYAGEFEVETLAEILCDPSTEYADDRRICVELQLDSNVPLSAPLLTALILPTRLLEAEWFKSWQDKSSTNIEIRTYELSPLRLAAHYQACIEGVAAELV